MEERKLNVEELDDVSGGKKATLPKLSCPYCDAFLTEDSFNPVKLGEGCDSDCQYTCPNCGKTFVK